MQARRIIHEKLNFILPHHRLNIDHKQACISVFGSGSVRGKFTAIHVKNIYARGLRAGSTLRKICEIREICGKKECKEVAFLYSLVSISMSFP